jgi:hypothetical protein
MISNVERTAIRTEIEAILKDYGIGPPQEVDLSAEDSLRARTIATRLMHGDMDRHELSKLDDTIGRAVAIAAQRLMTLRNSIPIRQLQKTNPYYSVFQAKIVRDRVNVTQRRPCREDCRERRVGRSTLVRYDTGNAEASR